jgi:hypothetical protein
MTLSSQKSNKLDISNWRISKVPKIPVQIDRRHGSFLYISDENVPGGVRYATWGLGIETLDFNTAAEKALSIYYVSKRTGWVLYLC